MSAVILAALLAAAPSPQVKLATVGFTQVGLSDAQANFFAEHFSSRMAEDDNVRVTTPKDMQAVLGVEKQRQLLGCSDGASSCMAELAGALGADGIVVGQIAKVGKSYQLNIKILASDGSRTLFLHSSKLLSSEEALIEELNEVALKATHKVAEQLGRVAAPPVAAVETTSSGPGRPLWKLTPVAVGVVALGVSAAFFLMASGQWTELNDSSKWSMLDPTHAAELRDGGRTNVVIGSVLAGVGAAAVIAGLAWYFGSPSTPAVSFFAGPNQGGLMVQGALP